MYFSFSILLVHNTLPTLSVSVIKASKHPDFVRGGRFPPPRVFSKDKWTVVPTFGKRKKKACCNRNVWCVGPRVLFLTSLDSALLLLSTYSLTHSPSLGSPPSFLSGLQPHSLGLMRLIPPSLTRFSFCGVHSLNLGSHTHRTTLSLAIPNCSDGALRIMMTIPHALLNFHPNTSAPLIKSCRPCSNF